MIIVFSAVDKKRMRPEKKIICEFSFFQANKDLMQK